MKRSCRKRILEDLRSACRELFHDYGISGTFLAAAPEAEFGLAGVIEYDGEDLRGNLAVLATTGLVDDMRAQGHACEQDWVAELANQLMGRLKLKLIRRRVLVRLKPPRLIPVGQVNSITQQLATEVWFRSGSGVIGLHLGTISSEVFALQESDSQIVVICEGETKFFK